MYKSISKKKQHYCEKRNVFHISHLPKVRENKNDGAHGLIITSMMLMMEPVYKIFIWFISADSFSVVKSVQVLFL